MSDNKIIIPDHLYKLIEKIFFKLNMKLQPKLEVSSPLKPGDNWLGQLLAITATGKDDKQRLSTLNLIAKMAPFTKIHKDVLVIDVVFEREIYMYSKVLPEFINIQKEKKVKNMFAPFVKCYETSLDKNEEILLLENMKQHGHRSINHKIPLNYAHMAFFIKVLGKFHALSFALREQKPELFEEIGRNTIDTFYSKCNNYVVLTQNLAERILPNLEKGSRTYKVFEHFMKDPSFVIREIIKPEVAGKYAVICHGDFQTRNCLFKYEDTLNPDIPTDLAILDWQMSKFCSPALDISFLLWICSDKKLRSDHYEEFVEMYYSSFSSFLRELGGSPEKSYPQSVLKEDLKKFSVAGLYFSIWHILSNSMHSKDVPDFVLAGTGEDLIDMFLAAVNDTYFVRIKETIEDFVEYGYDLTPNISLS